jgi:hypothetical protein
MICISAYPQLRLIAWSRSHSFQDKDFGCVIGRGWPKGPFKLFEKALDGRTSDSAYSTRFEKRVLIMSCVILMKGLS